MNCRFLLLLVSFPLASFAQNGPDIILFDISIQPTSIILTKPVNITSHKGYDNQPFFSGNNIYYSSEMDSGQMDIQKYNYHTGITSVVTHTEENEFSPTVTPDGKFISCILQRMDKKQDLVKYPIKGGSPVTLINTLKVGYHAWADKNILLLFVLEDTNRNALHYYNVTTREDKKITTDIGRSLQKIPGKTAVSFIQRTAGASMINEYDVKRKKVTTIMPALHDAEFLTWTRNGIILMSDGKDIYFTKRGKDNWQKVIINGDVILKNISRLALNEQNTKIAVVAEQ